MRAERGEGLQAAQAWVVAAGSAASAALAVDRVVEARWAGQTGAVGSGGGARWVALRAAGREVAVSEVKQVVAMGVAWEVVMAVAATVAVAKAVD